MNLDHKDYELKSQLRRSQVVRMSESETDKEPKNYHKFLIIGGGISGLSAASHLAKNGFRDFRLLEARNRLGGRIATMQIGQFKPGTK